MSGDLARRKIRKRLIYRREKEKKKQNKIMREG